MKRKLIFLLTALTFMSLKGISQTTDPSVKATAYYYSLEKKMYMESTDIENEQAPLNVTFKANPADMDGWTPSFEWRCTKVGSGKLFVRYQEETSYSFTQSGIYQVELRTYLYSPTDTVQLDAQTIKITILSSKLEMPNAFSPNGDGRNDVYRAKKGYKSIVSFRAIIFNRWGQKLYEWNDPADGWDGKYHGKDVAEGTYFVVVNAKGADGLEYNIRRDVNLLRGYSNEEGSSTTTP